MVTSALLLGIYIGARLVIAITHRTAPRQFERNAVMYNREAVAAEVLALISSLRNDGVTQKGDQKRPKRKRK
ncbi:hypothetical protein [Streptomyces sp. NPDC048489]|uniref:hypothetical protein n=1 Tax=Streptomyces sp. NPDC048489 TaxID=3154504 RepID=UPI00341432AF